jgi:diguanylate cyclase (GGDEF)-like protein/PAS domain S-box-containing protein
MPSRILLVETDSVVAETIIGMLTHSGESANVEWAGTCSEGLARLHGIGAILLDLSLPDSIGIDTFERLFSAAPAIPILLLIDPQEENTARQAVQHGAQDYLFKTDVGTALLRRAVTSMLERAAYSEAVVGDRERARVTLDSIGDAVVSTDVSGAITYLNAVAEGLTGWTRDEAIGQRLEDVFRLIDAETRAAVQNPMTLAIRYDKAVLLSANSVMIRRDGLEVAVEDSAAPIHDRHGVVTGAVMVFRDVSVTRAVTRQMSYLAQHDSLTDLPNRVLLNDRVTEAIALSSRHRRKLALLFLDIDRFKHINDSLGHAVGDGLLQSVARRLFTCVRGSDTVARQGGDEFVVLLWDLRRPDDAAITAGKLLEALRKPHYINGHQLHVTASIGIAIYPDDGANVETLMTKADLAMYHAKETGRDSYQFFESAMNARAIERRSLEESLHHVIARRELMLHYQPQLSLLSGQIIGAEALIRWQHPQRGFVPPTQFLPIAEDCGLIVSLGRWVLREACLQMRSWQGAGLPQVRLAINISAVELRAPGFAASVRAILAETGLAPHDLEFELTETGLLEGSRLRGAASSTAAVLEDLKDLGVLLALDDFGTGYSSLSHLKHLPIDTLKIDQSFVRDLKATGEGFDMVTGLIGLGRCLHTQVVAEGVETREQLEILTAYGCPQGQGFYFSPPVASAEFSRLLARDAAGMRLPAPGASGEPMPQRALIAL